MLRIRGNVKLRLRRRQLPLTLQGTCTICQDMYVVMFQDDDILKHHDIQDVCRDVSGWRLTDNLFKLMTGGWVAIYHSDFLNYVWHGLNIFREWFLFQFTIDTITRRILVICVVSKITGRHLRSGRDASLRAVAIHGNVVMKKSVVQQPEPIILKKSVVHILTHCAGSL